MTRIIITLLITLTTTTATAQSCISSRANHYSYYHSRPIIAYTDSQLRSMVQYNYAMTIIQHHHNYSMALINMQAMREQRVYVRPIK